MRKYKAFVIDLKKAVKTAATVTVGISVAVCAFFLPFKPSSFLSPERIMRGSNPVFKASNTDTFNLSLLSHKASVYFFKLLLGYYPKDISSVFEASYPVYTASLLKSQNILIYNGDSPKSEKSNGISTVPKASDEAENIPQENRAPIKQIDASQRLSQGFPVAIGNETSYGIDINSVLSQNPDINMSVTGPKVLITHTHATEAYAADRSTFYDKTASDRSEDTSKNVVCVGEELKKVFESYGIETLHDTILHDVPSFNGSYAHSLSTVSEYLQKYPSIQIVFDIHRDSIVYDDNTKAKTATEINGETVAQLMFVVGTDQKGLYNPDWRENIKSAMHFQKAISAKHPNLMRHINLRKERFNGHTTHSSMIIEVGTSGNSLNEALRGIRLAGECIAEYLKNF